MKILSFIFLIVPCFPIINFYGGELYQFGTINNLTKGALYQGIVSVGQIKGKADIGMGCGVGLGEVIIDNGKFFLADPYGNISEMKNDNMMPFLTAAKIDDRLSTKFNISNVTLSELPKILAEKHFSDNLFYAIRISGKFSSVLARSEDIDHPPYHQLGEWVKTHEHRFTLKDVKGVAVGVKSPEFISGGIGVEYHFHFISSDLKKGGHVLDMNIKSAVVEMEPFYEMKLILPRTEEYFKADLSDSPDRSGK